ncbi:MAG: nucleotidyltransferase family protein [Bacteroidales bacterium]|nr:nucleotidyltransferase family protein [Bacteroidales bacterium]
MNSRYHDYFCSVLRAGLCVQPFEHKLSPAEKRLIWDDAAKQTVSGLIANAFLTESDTPPKTAEVLQKKILKIAANNFKHNSVLADSVKALEDQSIHPVLLKGQGVGSFYNEPLLRESGDIDLYVGKGNYQKAFETLKKSLHEVHDAVFEENEKHSHLIVDGIPIELHQFSDVLPRKYDSVYQKISDSCLAGNHVMVNIGGVNVRTPEPTFNAFFIFNHLWRHFIAVGVGFRQICDWTVFLHANKGKIDLAQLEEMLNSLDLMKPWKVFGNIAVRMLRLPEREMPFYDTAYEKDAGKVLAMVMKEGNFGHEREERWKESKISILDKVRVFSVSTARYMKLFPMFGALAFQEYKMRLRTHLLGKA